MPNLSGKLIAFPLVHFRLDLKILFLPHPRLLNTRYQPKRKYE
jgi:hypothetical protein